jgi:hypothetical protein
LLHEEQPYTFLFAPNALECVNKRCQNIQVFATGAPEKIMWVKKDIP